MSSVSRTRIGLFAAFAGLGVTAAFIPAILPSAERGLATTLGAAVPALFAGLLVGVLLSGPLLVHRSWRAALLLGSALQSAAIITVTWAWSPEVFISAAAIAGLGFGLVEAGGSVGAKSATTGSATGLLSAMMGTVAVCAALTPLLIVGTGGARPVLSVLAAVPLIALAALSERSSPLRPAAEGPVRRDVHVLITLLPFAIALPLYVGVETVLSGWSSVIPERALSLDPAVAALGTSAFWALMALGRFGAAALRRVSVPPLTILTVGTFTAAGLMVVAGMLVENAPVVALLALAASIVLLAPSYGLIVGLALDRLDPARSAAATGPLVACGAFGGAFVPTLVLFTSRDPASSATFFISAALCAVVPLLMLSTMQRASRPL